MHEDHSDTTSLIGLIDPMTMVVMNKAMAASILTEPKSTLNEVIDETQQVNIRLRKIMENPSNATKNELEEMRSFCGELSIKARAYQPSLYMRQPQHPFRR